MLIDQIRVARGLINAALSLINILLIGKQKLGFLTKLRIVRIFLF